jgi:hypothetical protein
MVVVIASKKLVVELDLRAAGADNRRVCCAACVVVCRAVFAVFFALCGIAGACGVIMLCASCKDAFGVAAASHAFFTCSSAYIAQAVSKEACLSYSALTVHMAVLGFEGCTVVACSRLGSAWRLQCSCAAAAVPFT